MTCPHGNRHAGLCLPCADLEITQLREEIGWLRSALENAEATIQAHERGVRHDPPRPDARCFPSMGTDATDQWRVKEERVRL